MQVGKKLLIVQFGNFYPRFFPYLSTKKRKSNQKTSLIIQ